MNQPKIAYGSAFDAYEDRNELVLQQLPQVHFIARQIYDRLPKQAFAFEDLVHAGVLGLIDALRNYDPRKNVQLSTFAGFRIRGAIMDSIREMDWGPRMLRKNGRRLEDAIEKLQARLHRSPIEEEIAAELNISLAELHILLAQLDALDLVCPTMNSRNEEDPHDLIESASASGDQSPFEQCARTEAKGFLADAINKLPEKERMILSLYYHDELTMSEIGKILGLVESRVCQLHALAVRKLRSTLNRSKVSVLCERGKA